ncbi:MBL fold metallo-hydrolase [Methanocella sp. CWC-04]|uniref:MBL fold metallo-hydrolase n=1 Tax=Methanooceanicella nereidis TaxID=2052831 RepID=A0AAP2RDJ8_9EURY|nr:rhodanese-like domain-containing protein [Methanocella sp. CWC-04]MCD1295132.1 MBL fold metallo-hydrolase [Methanocella sp. CWC-04]
MIFERIKSEGLAHNSYFISSGNEAAVIDPRRDIDIYTDIARRNCTSIKYIFETHRNEDYVIGSTELKAVTGAAICHGKGLDFKYGDISVKEGDTFEVGSLMFRSLETPGHTPESITYVLYEKSAPNYPFMAFTGDVLFIGSVGRTDLWKDKETASGILYDSIMNKVLPLGDSVIVCPAHGAGSVCGPGISSREQSTVGYEKATNPYLKLSREEFVAKKVAEPLDVPYYFKRMEAYNKDGPPVTGGPPACAPMGPEEFKSLSSEGIIIDTRMPHDYAAHIAGSYNIWLKGMALFPGWIVDHVKPIYLVTGRDDDVFEAVKYLYRIGLENVKGYLCGGFTEWVEKGYDIEYVGLLSVDSLAVMLGKGDVGLLDVRSDIEWNTGHIREARHIFVGELESRIGEVPKEKPIACLCSTGRRASLGSSILKRSGIGSVYTVLGSMKAWMNKDYPVVNEKLMERKGK